ncbi:AmmeMemoRadiSam system protein A [Natronospora cellulosivora (SeqCode)]
MIKITNKIFIELAKKAMKEYITQGKKIQAPDPLPVEFDRKAGSFVSIKKDGDLRGCIGTVKATQDNLAEEIIENAISASTQDPRFPSIKERELADLKISVDVLGQAEEIDNIQKLDPENYGVIVEKGNRRGLLLPNLEGVDTVEEQVGIALRKAGIYSMKGVQLYRFQVRRYE